MKIRQSFVSNSSSSSFVALGVKVIPPDFGDDYDASDKWYNTTIGLDDGDIKGKILANDSDNLPDGQFSLQELTEMAATIAQENNVDVSEVKLYFGTYPC